MIKKPRGGGGGQKVEVVKKPDPPPAGGPKTARILNMAVGGAGVTITIGIGTDFGVAAGWKAKIAGVNGTFPVASCNARTCSATVTATPDQIKAGGSSVTLSP